MRKINTANKRSFGIFGVIVLILLACFCAVMLLTMKNGDTAYATEKGDVIYDSNVELVETASEGEITKLWNKNYYVTLSGGDKYDLGKNNVVFNSRKRDVKIYGDGYKVNNNGTVETISDETTIKNTGIQYGLYKLDDRRYLITGGDINCADQDFTTRTYLEVFIDKGGNAQLVNNTVNMKTVKPMVLTSGDVVFDIAREELKVGDKTVDLKAIGGSTNQFEDKDADNKKDDNSGNGGSSSSSNSQNISGGGGSGQGSGSESKKSTVPANLERSITLRGTKADVTSIKVNYSIVDVENKYASCYLLVNENGKDEEEAVRIELNKADNEIELRSLKPDTLYSISLCYDMYVKDGNKTVLRQNVQNVVKTKTSAVFSEIRVERMTSKYITARVYTDKNYLLDSADLQLQSDGTPVTTVSVNIAESVKDGWVVKLNVEEFSEYTEEYTLKLINGKYEGEAVNLKARYTFKNSLIGLLLNSLFSL